MSEYPFSFHAEIVAHAFGDMTFTIVYVPAEVVPQLPLDRYPRLRIEGEVNGVRIDAAFMPAKGKWYMMVSKKFLRLCGLSIGDVAFICFDIADQDAITVPDELRFALDADDDAAAAWMKLTTGKRRGFAYRVASAKMPETRERRAQEIIELLRL